VERYATRFPPSKDAPGDLLRFALAKGRFKLATPASGLEKAIRKATKRKDRPKSFPRLKKDAWDAFSKFIRQRDADESGHAKCCTFPNIRDWKGMDAGHFVSRLYESTLFDPQNVHAQCKGCNMPPHNGRRIEYAAFLDAKYGEGTAMRLQAKAKRRKLERWELERIIENCGKVSA